MNSDENDDKLNEEGIAPLLQNFNIEEARQKLKETMFRGRKRPSVSELLSHAEYEEDWEPKCDNGKKFGCDNKNNENLKWERIILHFQDESADDDNSDKTQNEIPLIIVRKRETICKIGVVILHSTGSNSCDERYMSYMKDIASCDEGLIAIGMDTRYHGKRGSINCYFKALKRVYEGSLNACPFIYDSAVDISYVADFLLNYEHCSIDRLAITGISLGGMHAWFAGAIDTRWEVVIPLIGVQSFRYAVKQNQFQGRIRALLPLFEHVAVTTGAIVNDSNCSGCDKLTGEDVKETWLKICPGLMDGLDGVALACLCPRFTLIGTGELDDRCPVQGVKELEREARIACWDKSGFGERLKVKVYKNIGHCVTEEMWEDSKKFLKDAFSMKTN